MPGLSPSRCVEERGSGREDEQRQREKQTDHPNYSVNSLQAQAESHRILKLIWQRKRLGTAKDMVKNNSETGLALSVNPIWLFYPEQQRDRRSHRETQSSFLWELAVA